MKFIYLFCFCFCYFVQITFAQNDMHGLVLDEQNNPLARVNVMINESPFEKSNEKGAFIVRAGEKKGNSKKHIIQGIRTYKEGFLLKDWLVEDNILKVIMAKHP